MNVEALAIAEKHTAAADAPRNARNSLERLEARIEDLKDKLKAFADDSVAVCPLCSAPVEEQNVEGLTYMVRVPSCECEEKCRDSLEVATAQYESLRKFRAKADALIQANRPGRFLDARVDTWPGRDSNREAYKIASSFVKSFHTFPSKGLLFMGSVGGGKSHLIFGIANDLIREGIEAKVIKVGHWIRRINLSYRGDENIEETLIEPVFEAPCLLLDDLGKESTTEATRRVIYELFDHRWQQELPTVITTNFGSLNELHQHYSDDPIMQEAISSRILGQVQKFYVNVNPGGVDHRTGVKIRK